MISLLIFILFLSPLFSANTQNDGVRYDISPFILIYQNGTVERLFGTQTVPASLHDPTAGVSSKDVNTATVSARLYLPATAVPGCRLPLLVYFHGGAFFTESAFSPTYHNFLNSLVSKARVVAVSVNYHLAPENPLPLAYEDCLRALDWVFSHRKGGTEAWLRYHVDFKQVYLGGDSAGGNIAHNVAVRAGLDRVRIRGMFLNCPHFWGTKRIGREMSNPMGVALMESIWLHAYPNSTGLDDPSSNPAYDPNIGRLAGRSVLVYVAEKDVLRDRGWYYASTVRKSKWRGKIRVVEVKGEDHVFNLNRPNTTKAIQMEEDLASFLNQGVSYTQSSIIIHGNTDTTQI